MKLNIGRYLEERIRCSEYSKKDICNEINRRYKINDKPLSYTTFSNNVKEGNLSLNETIALATIIDLDLNRIVNAYKNKYNQTNKKGDEYSMKNIVTNILNSEVAIEGVAYKEENVYKIDNDCYECYYLSEDGDVAIMQSVLFMDYDNKGYITEKAYFTNFRDILGECNMSLSDFKEMPINEKLCFLSDEGCSALEILGEDEKEVSFSPSKYIED